MAASSQSSVFSAAAKDGAGATLPPMKCDDCRRRTMIRLVSKSEDNPGRVFFNCPNHKRPADGSCHCFFRIEAYVEILLEIGVEVSPMELDLVSVAAAEQGTMEELGPLTVAAISGLQKQRKKHKLPDVLVQESVQMKDVSVEIKLRLDVLVGIGKMILCVSVLILAVNLYAVMK
ncbi:hypothetical protein ACQ4PT_041062 [Festuca glaucescens]